MKRLLILILPLLFAHCTTDPATWDNSFNPLDKPMHQKPTAEQIHNKNVGNITGDQARKYDTPVDMW